MTDLLALGAIAGMGFLGWHRGALGMALLAGGLFGGYLAALLFFRPLGRILESITGLPGIVAYPLGGMAALTAASTAIDFVARRHRRDRAAKIAEGWEPGPGDEIGGMVLGGTYGVAIVLIVSWAAMSLGGILGGQELAIVRESVTGRLSTQAIRRAVTVPARAVVGDRFVASSAARMVADPLVAVRALNGIMADSDMQELLRSGAMQEAARLQDVSVLAGNESLTELAGNPTFAAAMRTFGLADEGSGAVDPTALAEAIIREAGPALRSIDALAEDPNVSRILEGADFRQAWEAGDFMRLVRAAEFRPLFDRVLEELRRNR